MSVSFRLASPLIVYIVKLYLLYSIIFVILGHLPYCLTCTFIGDFCVIFLCEGRKCSVKFREKILSSRTVFTSFRS